MRVLLAPLQVVPLAVVHFPDDRFSPVRPCQGGGKQGQGNIANSPCQMDDLHDMLFGITEFLETSGWVGWVGVGGRVGLER